MSNELTEDESTTWDAERASRLIRDLPSPPEWDVSHEYVTGFEIAIEYAAEIANQLAIAIGEIERLRGQASKKRSERMNSYERSSWRVLLGLGARRTEIAGKAAIDLRPIRATSEKKLRLLVQAIVDVAGRSGCNRRHVDRSGIPVYVVTGDPDLPIRP